MKAIRKTVSLLLCLAMVISMCAGTVMAADGSGVGGGDNITVDFPDIYPEEALKSMSKVEISNKVEALLRTMTEEEMYSMLGGVRSANSKHGFGTGYMPGVPRLGVPVSRSWDGPKGAIADRQEQETTSPASQMALGSSWDVELAYDYGAAVGKDNKASAGNMQLGTQIDVTRSLIAGRERDTISEDGYLIAQIGDPYAKAIEDNNVIAVLKHYVCYVAEFSHGKDDVIVDEQTLFELYLAPWEYIIENGNASGVMSAYNLINGVQAASNDYLQNTVLREMWGFDGLVVTDWGGNTELSIKQGTDMEMGTINHHNQENIEAAIAEGTLEWDDVVNAVRHTLTAMGNVGYLGLVTVNQSGYAVADENPPEVIELAYLEPGSEERNELLAENDEVAYESAVGSGVLLKNENDALPVSADESIAMIGLPAARTVTGHYSESAFGWLGGMTGAYEAMVELLGEDADIDYAIGEENIFGNDIPSEWLYTSEDLAENGVNVEVTEDGETTTSVVDELKFTTNSKTYKNAEDGNAFVYGQDVTITTYISVPESGTYQLKALNGGLDTKSVQVEDLSYEEPVEDDSTEENNDEVSAVADFPWGGGGTQEETNSGIWSLLSSSSGGCGPAAGQFGTSSAVCTEEGMDIPSSFTSIEMEAGKVYKLTATISAKYDSMDAQLQVTYQTDATKAADEAAMLEAAANNDKIIFFGYDQNTTFEGLAGKTTQYSMLQKIIEVAEENGNQVIVVLETAVPGVMREWIDDVDAVLWMSLPGQAGGRAEAALLTGAENPSGKLSVTVVKDVDYTKFGEDYNGHSNAEGAIGNIISIDEGGEGIYNGYKWYDKYGLQDQVEFDFGYGLSYTSFEYSDLSISKVIGEVAYDVTFTVTNTGNVTGSEVAQVYLGAAEVPEGVQMAEYALAAFTKIKDLEPGESREVTVTVEERQLSYWYTDMEVESETDEKWVVAEGERTFYVGAASDNLILSKTVDVSAEKEFVSADVTIDSVKAQPGEEIEIDVEIENNLGIAGYLINIECDSEYVTITDVIQGDTTFGGNFATVATENGYKILWSNATNNTANGTLLTIKAEISEDAPKGEYPVTATYSAVNTIDENGKLVILNVVNGNITVRKITPGDINDDGIVTNADIVALARYLVNLTTFSEDQLIAADFNADGKVNNADVVAMARYILTIY